MRTRCISRASGTRATPARRPAASAALESSLLPALLSLLILGSCAAPRSTSDPKTVAYSVLKKAKDRFVVEAALSGQSHVLAVFGAQWSTLTLGEATDSGQEIKIAAESDDPLPSDVGQFTGKVLAVRCKEAKGDRIEVDFRVYEVQHGHIVAQKRSKDSLAEGELKELELPW